MRTRFLVQFFAISVFFVSWAGAAQAQVAEGFALSRFAPAPTTEDGFALQWPRTLEHLRPGAVLTFDYAHAPLVLAAPNGTRRVAS